MKRLNPPILVSLLLVLLCSAMAIFIFLDAASDKREESTNLFYHYYSIEPASLLEVLGAGSVNLFSPIAEEPPFIPLDQQAPVPWTQDDYFRIANALIQFVWGEKDTLKSWQLKSMDFDLGCEDVGIGFQDGNFRFFRIAKTDERESRIVRIVNIDPRNKFVFITENEYFPILADWSAVGLGQNLLSAEEILQIAEGAGGREMRLSVKDACDISLLLSPDSASYKGWWITYSRRDDRTTLFHLDIDPVTGEIH